MKRNTIAAVILILGLLAVMVAPIASSLTLMGESTMKDRKGNPILGRLEKSDAEWRKELAPEQYRVTRHQATECAFTGEHWNTKGEGTYYCVCCGQPLFESSTKFDSGTGWPQQTQ